MAVTQDYLAWWAAEIAAGRKTFDDFRWAVNVYANQDPYADADFGKRTESDSQWASAGTKAVQDRLIAIARNRGTTVGALAAASQPTGSMDSVNTVGQGKEGTTYSPAPPSSAPSTPDNSLAEQAAEDAWGIMESTLANYGFTPDEIRRLRGQAMPLLTQGHSSDYVLAQLEQSDVFHNRFPEIKLRREKGFSPMTPGQIVAFRNEGKALFRRYGLPAGFYDSDSDFTQFMANNISFDELNSRVIEGFAAAQQAPKEVRDYLARNYGVSEGGLAAFFLDPNKAEAIIKKQFAASRIGGAAEYTGYGKIGRETAEGLTTRIESVQEAEEGFGTLAAGKELFAPITGHEFGEDTIGQDTQFASVFDNDIEARERIRKRGRRRQSPFESGGSFASGRSGFEGLGEAD